MENRTWVICHCLDDVAPGRLWRASKTPSNSGYLPALAVTTTTAYSPHQIRLGLALWAQMDGCCRKDCGRLWTHHQPGIGAMSLPTIDRLLSDNHICERRAGATVCCFLLIGTRSRWIRNWCARCSSNCKPQTLTRPYVSRREFCKGRAAN